ncbi:putative aminopeptidase NPEPL1 [Blattella germanica]|nr:putative aminopeptidase NPEPL1 [Blattella germanica]
MSSAKLQFLGHLTPSDPQTRPVVIIGQVKNLAKVKYADIKVKLEPRVTEEVYLTALASLHPSPTDTCSLYLNLATLAALPVKCSRHNAPSRAHAITKITSNNPSHASNTTVNVEFLLVPGADSQAGGESNGGIDDKLTLSVDDIKCLESVCSGVRLAARIVDAPCNEMNVDHFLQEVKTIADTLGVSSTIIRGEELRVRGFGGIYGVGKAASVPPALAVLSHTPEGATQTIAWVGKGIVYDTGGLSIKAKTAMPGMKRDCGGAAGVLGAFYTAVRQGFTQNLHAVFCLAENAVGPESTRPDDIHLLTVEINNTDAEGRLVLSDGVAYAQKDLKANIILDMATLTGAQGISTGKYHGAVLTNSEEWEDASFLASRVSGDLLFPIPYCPELHFSEFASAVADMKNSVAGERATGYGVALLAALFGNYSQDRMLRSLSPVLKYNGPGIGNACKKLRRN